MTTHMIFTKSELTPVCAETFRCLQAALPSDLARRLTSNRVVRTHGTKGNLRPLCRRCNLKKGNRLPSGHPPHPTDEAGQFLSSQCRASSLVTAP
jgi:5-methylcytosine-specific restriction endonuclease McrA